MGGVGSRQGIGEGFCRNVGREGGSRVLSGGVWVPGGLHRLQSGWDGRSPSGGFDSRPPPPIKRMGSDPIRLIGRRQRSHRDPTLVSARRVHNYLMYSLADREKPISEGLVSVMFRLPAVVRKINPPGKGESARFATMQTLESGGEIRITDLAQRHGVTQPGMSQLVDRLVEAGDAVRKRDDLDRRAVVVELTDQGRQTLHDRISVAADALDHLLDRLTESERAAIDSALPALQKLTSWTHLEDGDAAAHV